MQPQANVLQTSHTGTPFSRIIFNKTNDQKSASEDDMIQLRLWKATTPKLGITKYITNSEQICSHPFHPPWMPLGVSQDRI
jgi:hypothetical protein